MLKDTEKIPYEKLLKSQVKMGQTHTLEQFFLKHEKFKNSKIKKTAAARTFYAMLKGG